MSDHFFKSVKIENFRGIKSLEISDLARVNLFVGKNGCGKTSVLESVYCLAQISNPGSIIDMQNKRVVGLSESSDIPDFFYNRHHEKGLVMSSVQAKTRRNLEILPLYRGLQVKQTGLLQAGLGQAGGNPAVLSGNGDLEGFSYSMGATETGQALIGLGYRFVVSDDSGIGQDGPHEAGVYLKEIYSLNLGSLPSPDYKERMKGFYLSNEGYGPGSVDKMLNEKKKDLLLPFLQSLDDKITDIRVGVKATDAGVQSLVLVDIGLDRFIPINLLGDGMMRLLSISTGISTAEGGVLMIDEIENGLHVTALEQLWKIVLDWSEKYDVQIFTTTHSEDVIKSLRNVLDENMFPDSVACYRLVKFEEGETEAYRYSQEQLGMALNSNTDIRV